MSAGDRLADYWLAESAAHSVGRGSLAIHRAAVRSLGHGMSEPVSRATRADVEEWVRSVALRPATLRYYLAGLRLFFAWAVDKGYRSDDPTQGVELEVSPEAGKRANIVLSPPPARGGATVSWLVKRYLHERTRRRELAPTTVTSQRHILSQFARFVNDRRARQVSRRTVERWLEESNVAPATLRTRLSAVQTFFAWAVEAGHLTKNPTVGIKPAREPRRLPRALKASQVARALAMAPDSRARVMLTLMAQEGLRCVEVAGVQVGDIDLSERVLIVKRAKGGHQRLLPLSDETMEALQTYLAECPARGGPLIRSTNQGREARGISPRHVSRLVSGCLHEADITETAHSLRHTMATDALRNGAHLRDVQTALGHVSLATTQRYMPMVVGDLRTALGGRRYRGATETNGASQ